MSKLTKRILMGLAAVLIIMQFFRIDKTNPPVESSKDFMTLMNPPADIAKVVKEACYDCHSNETKYPWYSNVAPVSWWLKGHINHARKHLNFSTWGDYEPDKASHKLEECYEWVEKKDMPLPSYTWNHPEARLTDAQRENLVVWFKDAYHKSEKKEKPAKINTEEM